MDEGFRMSISSIALRLAWTGILFGVVPSARGAESQPLLTVQMSGQSMKANVAAEVDDSGDLAAISIHTPASQKKAGNEAGLNNRANGVGPSDDSGAATADTLFSIDQIVNSRPDIGELVLSQANNRTIVSLSTDGSFDRSGQIPFILTMCAVNYT